MLSPQEMEKKILDLEKQLKEALQLQKRIGPSKKENTTLDLSSGGLIIPIKKTGGRAKKGELRFDGTFVYVYTGTDWSALT